MPAQSLYYLGDEPLYCEAVHDPEDDVYSGSDDDHYEGKLHRRLHIEKKAIDYLNGHVPVLLSARLHGPFDSQHWNNPWLSKRAPRQVEISGTQTTLSNLPVEKARDHGPDQVSEGNLPNTQGTSLYPLPSPEITNPPSARKHPYMEEDNYNRIKTWRETVKGISKSRDSFWLSQQDDSDDSPVTRKRSADQQWLHKRGSKRRKPTDIRTLPPDESPSQAASKMRQHETRRPQLVSQSVQSSRIEDELATDVNTKNAAIASRRVNRHMSTPRSRRIEQRSPSRKLRLQEAESSEDELSMPSTTPTRKAARPFVETPKTPGVDGSPKRPTTATLNVFESRNNREQSDPGRTHVEKIQASQLTVRQRFSIDAARRLSKNAARMGVTAAGSAGDSSRQEAAKDSNSVRNEEVEIGLATAKPRTYTEKLAETALSQQDNSFFFHKRGPSPKDPVDGTNPKRSSRQSHVAATAVGPMDGEHRGSHDEKEDDDDFAASDSANAMDVDSNTKQQLPCETVNNSETTVDAQVAEPILSAIEAMDSGETARMNEDDKIYDSEVMHVARADHELEATVEVETSSKSERTHKIENDIKAMPTDKPQVLVQDEGCAPSDTEWSTYLNTQDLLSTSATMAAVPQDVPGVPVVDQNTDDSSDSDWYSYVDTQDLSAFSPEIGVPQEVAQSVSNVLYQGPEDQTDSDWSTFFNIQDQSAVAGHQHADPRSDYEDAMGLSLTNPMNCTPVVEEEDDSNSEWSTYRSASSQVHGDQTGDTSHEPVPPEAPQDARPSQASVGSIIDAYADAEQAPGLFGPGGDSNVSHQSQQNIILAMSSPDSVKESNAGQEQGEAVMAYNFTTPLDIEAKDDSSESSLTDPGSFDEEPISIELRQIADVGVNNETPSSTEPQEARNHTNIELRTPQAAELDVDSTANPIFLGQTTDSLEPPQSQSPWATDAGPSLQVAWAPGTDTKKDAGRGIVDVTTTRTEPLEIQSPWAKEPGFGPHQPAAQAAPEVDTPLDGSSSTRNLTTNKSLLFSQPPQSPWMAQTPNHSTFSTPDFTLSIKAFSDFATPSPTKKRASFNGSILRDRFKTSLFRKPGRRVHFAPLPGEKEIGSIESQTGDDTIYVEEDVSYCTPGGHKTGTIRVPRPATRAASPPPMDVSSAEVGGILDHDPKFARHFEAVAKRKKSPSRKALRLLPSESQQTVTASQGVGLMAEAFIQASQTRRKALEMVEANAAEPTDMGEGHGSLDEKSLSPVSIGHMDGQENAEPVDDVSAVLDNLGAFLDNTWGVGLGAEEETPTQRHVKTPQGSNDAREVFDMVEDSMMALNTNVWAD